MVVKSDSGRAATAASSSSSASRSRPPRPEGSMLHALLVDDDVNFALGLAEVVGREGFATRTANTLKEANAEIAKPIPDVLLVDLHLPDGSGLDLLKELVGIPGADIILITGQTTVDTTVTSLRTTAS